MGYINRLESFKHAMNGFSILFSKEKNFKIHLALAIIACTLAVILNINSTEWFIVLLCIGAVLSAEALNTSIELICNKVEPNYSETIKSTKDIAAFAVLSIAIVSFIIGLIIFLPKIYSLLF